MHPQTNPWPLAVAIIVAAVLVCATLVILNVRMTYPLRGLGTDANGPVYLRLLYSGCTPQYVGGTADAPISVSCPLWVRP